MESFPKKKVSAPRKPGRWRRRLFWGTGTIMTLLLVGWAVCTSNWFLRAVLLPKASHALNAKVDFQNAEWSPDSPLRLTGLTIHGTGKRPLLKAAHLELDCHWRDLIAGRMIFNKITIEQPEIFLHIDRNGNPNYAPLLDRPQSEDESSSVRIGEFLAEDAQVEFRRDHQTGTTETGKLSGLTIQSGALMAGEPGEISLKSDVDYSLKQLQNDLEGVNGEFRMNLKLHLDEQWTPTQLQSTGQFQVNTATGQFAFAAGLKTEMKSKSTMDELQQFILRFTHAGNPLGNLQAKGTLQPAKGSADLSVVLEKVDHRVLNFFGRPFGYGFHSTVLDSTNQVQVADFGGSLKVNGSLSAAPFQISSRTLTSPPVENGTADFTFTINAPKRVLQLDALKLRAAHNGHPLFVGQLDQPMQFDWSGRVVEESESMFTLTAQNIDLKDWREFLGQYAIEGRVAAGIRVRFREAGRRIEFALASEGVGMRIREIDQQTHPAALRADGVLNDFNQLTLTHYSMRMGHTNAPIFKVTGDELKCDLSKMIPRGQANIQADLSRIRRWFPSELQGLNGQLDFNGTVESALRAPFFQAAKGSLKVAEFNFENGGKSITNLLIRSNVNLQLDDGHRLKINGIGARVYQNHRELAPHFTAIGQWDLRSGECDFSKIELEKFNLRILSEASGLLPFTNGTLAARVSLKHTPGQHSQVSGNVAFADAQQSGWPVPLHFTADGAVKLESVPRGKWPVSFTDLNLKFQRGNVLDGELQITGGWNPGTGTASFQLKSSELDHRLLTPWLAGTDSGFRWTGGKLKCPGEVEVRLDGQGGGTWRGMVHASGIKAEARDFDWPKAPINAEMYIDFSRTVHSDGPTVNTLRDANLKLMMPDITVARLRFNGQHWPEKNSWRLAFQPPAEKQKGFVSHQFLQTFLAESLAPVTLTQGLLQYPGRLEVLGDHNGSIRVKGDMELAGVQLNDPAKKWPDKLLDVKAKLDLTSLPISGSAGRRFESNGSHGQLFVNREHSGSFNVKGNFTPAHRQGNLDLDLRDWNQLILIPLSKILGGPDFQTVRVRMLKGNVQFNKQGTGQLLAQLQADELRLMADPERAKARALRMDFSGSVTNRVFQFKQCIGTMTYTNFFERPSDFKLTGSLDYSEPSAPSGQIRVASNSLDIPAIENTFRQFSVTRDSNATKNQTSIFRNFQWDFDVKQMRWFDLTGTNVVGSIVRKGSEVHLKLLEMKLFGAPVMAEGWFVPQGNRTRYAMSLSCEKMPLNQLNDYFKLKRTRNYGLLNARFHVAANALNGLEFQKSFLLHGIDSGPAYFTTTQAHWAFFKDNKMPNPNVIPSPLTSLVQVVPGLSVPMDVVSGSLGWLASFLGDKELEASHLDQGQLWIAAKDGVISHDFTVAGPLVRANVEGKIQLAEHWMDSGIEEDIRIELAPEIANKYSPTGIVFKKKNFVGIPPCLKVSGKLRAYDFQTIKTGIVLMQGGRLTAAPGRLFRKLPIPLVNKEEDMILNPLDLLRWIIPGGD